MKIRRILIIVGSGILSVFEANSQMTVQRLLTSILASLIVTFGSGSTQVLGDTGDLCGSQKISDISGGFSGGLDRDDLFGARVKGIGDLDGDGVNDLAVTAPGDDDGATWAGAIWLLFMNSDGTVKTQSKLSATSGGWSPTSGFNSFYGFGNPVALGDLSGNGEFVLAVGVGLDDTGGTDTGGVWLLTLNQVGEIIDSSRIDGSTPGFIGAIGPRDQFGFGIEALGDIDGDNVPDLAVSGLLIDNSGVVFILFLNPDGTVKRYSKIGENMGGFSGTISPGDHFGVDLGRLGDVNGDAIPDLAVGALGVDDGGHNKGAVWVLFLDATGEVVSNQKISDLEGGFSGRLNILDQFGHSLDGLGDIDGDGIPDLGVGAAFDDDGGLNTGAVYFLLMNSDGTVKSDIKVDGGSFVSSADEQENFGISLSLLESNASGDSVKVAVGGMGDDDGGVDQGSVTILCVSAGDSDSDGDGIPDDEDNCPSTANAGQIDTDGDGVGDVCDSDIDGDGVSNELDNCVFAVNPDQSDFDRDGEGDACDADVDGDGVTNEDDRYPFSDTSAMVVIDGCDSGVGNILNVDGQGSSLSDLLAECTTAKNHGKYVSCVAGILNILKKEGLISGRDKGAIVGCASQADLP